MSRLSDFLTNGQTLNAGPLTAVLGSAGEAIAAGDLVTIGADGLAYWAADPSSAAPLPSLRPISQVFATYNTAQGPVSTILGSGMLAPAGAGGRVLTSLVLSTGNYVIAWITGAQTVQFAIFNATGALQGSIVTVGPTSTNASNSANQISLIQLSGGGFVVTHLNAANQPMFAIYNNAGAVVTAATLIEATAGQVFSLSVCPLSSGGFAVGYFSNAANVKYAVYTASGAVTKAPTVVKASTVNTAWSAGTSVCGLTGGGFVLAYGTSDGSASYAYFTKYDNTGAITLAETLLNTSAANTSGAAVCTCALTGGGFAIAAGASSGTTFGQLRVYNAAGVIQGSANNITTANTFVDSYVMAALPNGNVAYAGAMAGTTGPAICYYSGTTGAPVSAGIPTSVTAAWPVPLTAQAQMQMAVLSNANVAIGYAGYIVLLDTTCSLVGTGPILCSASATGIATPVIPVANAIKPSVASYSVAVSTGAVLTQCLYSEYLQKQTPIGVATNSAAQGAPVQIQITGGYTMRLNFSQPYTINAQRYTPPGQQMSIIGNTAMMYGVQTPAQQRSIN